MVTWDLYWERHWDLFCSIWSYVEPATTNMWVHLSQFVNSDFFSNAVAAAAGALFGGGALFWFGYIQWCDKRLAEINANTALLSALFSKIIGFKQHIFLPGFEEAKENYEVLKKNLSGESNQNISLSNSTQIMSLSFPDLTEAFKVVGSIAHHDIAPSIMLRNFSDVTQELSFALSYREEARKSIIRDAAVNDLKETMCIAYGLKSVSGVYNDIWLSSFNAIDIHLNSALWFLYYMRERYNRAAIKSLPKFPSRYRKKLNTYDVWPEKEELIPPKDYLKGFEELL